MSGKINVRDFNVGDLFASNVPAEFFALRSGVTRGSGIESYWNFKSDHGKPNVKM